MEKIRTLFAPSAKSLRNWICRSMCCASGRPSSTRSGRSSGLADGATIGRTTCSFSRAIRILLYSEGYTIKGVQRILKEQGVRAVVTASQGSLRGATVLSLSERRARGASPEYLVEVQQDDDAAQASSFPHDDLFEIDACRPAEFARIDAVDHLPVAGRSPSHGSRSRRIGRMHKSLEGRATKLSPTLSVFPRFFRSAVASPESLVYKAGSRSVAQPG